MDINEAWPEIKSVFRKSFRSSLHFSIASIDPNGDPHITPIGSLILGMPGKAIYFEEFTQKLPEYCAIRNNVCVLAVNSNKLFWLKSLITGNFNKPPAVRLYGKLGKRRMATEEEVKLWQKRVGVFKLTKGHKLIWKAMNTVREIELNSFEAVNLGKITSNSWSSSSSKEA